MRFNYLDILEQYFHNKFRGHNKQEAGTFLQMISDDFKDMFEEAEQLKKESDKKSHQINRLEEHLKTLESKTGNRYQEILEQLPDIRQKSQHILKQAQNQARFKYKYEEKELNRIREEIKLLKGKRVDLLENIQTGAKTYLESLYKKKQGHADSDSKD